MRDLLTEDQILGSQAVSEAYEASVCSYDGALDLLSLIFPEPDRPSVATGTAAAGTA